jgi:uncharacterized protein (TIGR03437 family)
MKQTYLCFVLSAAVGLGQAVSPTLNGSPSREIGQPSLQQPLISVAPNLVEGREVNGPSSIAFDTSVTPPILYVVDSGNNRILAWSNPTSLSPCAIGSALPCGKANLVIGPRPGDFQTTLPGGPNANAGQLSTGLYLPSSIAVDSSGNLYVVDTENNRVLRFPAPFKQTSSLLAVDLVIGQKTASSGGAPNQGQQLPTAQTLNLTGGNFGATVAIDPSGNVWVTDPGNNRALMFPTSALVPNTILPTATLVLGESSFTSSTPVNPPGSTAQLVKTTLNQPTGMAFDSNGNLYITDSYYQRVMYYLSPVNANGLSASRILGICEQLPNAVPPQTCTPAATNQYQIFAPTGLFTDSAGHLYVAEAGNNRISEYDVPGNWPAPPNPSIIPQVVEDSPPILAVIGQNGPTDFTDGKANKGQPTASSSSVSTPRGGVFNAGNLWLADFGNNRVLGFQPQSGSYNTASYLAGQVDFFYSQPNLIEGRELYLTAANVVGGDVAIDHSSNPPHLYIADTYNNRILGFRNALTVQAGQLADIVIGQADLPGYPGSAFYQAQYNNPYNDPTIAVNTGLNRPSGVIVDNAGNLWVADTGNGRVLRFATPFTQTSGSQQTPSLVLGQSGYNQQQFGASQGTMQSPYGLALFSDGSLAVSDPSLNRILVFKRPAGGDFQSSSNASIVLGQQTFNNSSPAAGASGLSNPAHIAVDSSDRLYVADSTNNRLVVLNNTSPINAYANGSSWSFTLNNVDQPQGVIVNQLTGEIWVSLGNDVIWRLPELESLELSSNPNAPAYTQQLNLQTTPFAITLDDTNNLIVAEGSNRVTFYYPKLSYYNVASYNGGDTFGNYNQGLAPGQLALVFQVGQNFNFTPAAATTNPWPLTMSNLQITVNGVPAPIFRVDAIDICFQVPSSTPPTGTANYVVTNVTTGAIVAVGSIPMAQYNPAFFAANAQGFGAVAALNDGGTNGINSPSNPVSRNSNATDFTHYITFYLTGGGVFTGGPGAPPQDGYAPTALAATAVVPQMINTSFGANADAPSTLLNYSGAGGFAGGWQINWYVSYLIPPSSDTGGVTIVAVTLDGVPSTIGPSGSLLQLYFYAK